MEARVVWVHEGAGSTPADSTLTFRWIAIGRGARLLLSSLQVRVLPPELKL